MHSKELFSEYEANVRSYSRSFPEIFTKAKGAKMYDENGREYIENQLKEDKMGEQLTMSQYGPFTGGK